MKTIEIREDILDINIFFEYKAAWEESNNVVIKLSQISKEVLAEVSKFIISLLPDSFAYLLLSNLAEEDELPEDLVKEIFLKGDVACKVSVCLRKNVPGEVAILCERSTEPIVKEHYELKKKYQSN